MDQISSREKDNVVTKVTGALLFSVLGAMGFFYCLWKHNWNSAVWCLLLEVACTFVLVFNKPYLKGELHLQYSATFFRVMKYAAVFLCVAAWCAFVAYIALGATNKEVFDVRSHFAASPVALLAGFWFLVLFFDARKYEGLLE